MIRISQCNSWEEMLPLIEFLGDDSGSTLSTEFMLQEFEQQHNINFPPDYREFCRLFGTGIANNWLQLLCPGTSRIAASQEDLVLTANYIREFPSRDLTVDQQKLDILENGFIFADEGASCVLLWNLKTYRADDQSYDMYWAEWDSPQSEILEEDIKFVGRSFFEFVRDFCYGLRASELYESSNWVPKGNTYRRVRL